MSSILIGSGKRLERVDDGGWRKELEGARERTKGRMAFLTGPHRRVRNFAVSELLQRERPLPPEEVSAALGLDVPTVVSLLNDLEKNLFFLVRNKEGHVSWAYPVTCEKTPHRLKFTTGEETYAA